MIILLLIVLHCSQSFVFIYVILIDLALLLLVANVHLFEHVVVVQYDKLLKNVEASVWEFFSSKVIIRPQDLQIRPLNSEVRPQDT